MVNPVRKEIVKEHTVACDGFKSLSLDEPYISSGSKRVGRHDYGSTVSDS